MIKQRDWTEPLHFLARLPHRTSEPLRRSFWPRPFQTDTRFQGSLEKQGHPFRRLSATTELPLPRLWGLLCPNGKRWRVMIGLPHRHSLPCSSGQSHLEHEQRTDQRISRKLIASRVESTG